MQSIKWFHRVLFLNLVTLSLNNAQAQSTPEKGDLYKEIARMDSLLFAGYNSKNIEVPKNIFDKDLEFFHDKGGLANYENTMEGMKGLFTRVPDLNRELVPGSMEVYPIANYGAIQVGLHRFCHRENGQDDCGTFKFLHIWKRTPEGWKLTRIVSYDH